MSGFSNNVQFGVTTTLYRLTTADFNSTADQAMVKLHNYSAFCIFGILVLNPSISLTTAQGGFYTGAGKTGLTLVAATHAYAGLNATTAGIAVTIPVTGRGRLTADPIFSLTTPQGAAATADIYVAGFGVL